MTALREGKALDSSPRERLWWREGAGRQVWGKKGPRRPNKS